MTALDKADPRGRAGPAEAGNGPGPVACWNATSTPWVRRSGCGRICLDPQLQPLDVASVELNVFDPARPALERAADPHIAIGTARGNTGPTFAPRCPAPIGSWCGRSSMMRNRICRRRSTSCCRTSNSDNPRQNAKLLADLARETGGKYLTLENAAAELPALLPDRGERFAVDEQLRALWDRQWVLYLLVGLLGVEWLTRKLLRLA